MSKNLLFSTATELIRVPSDAVVYITASGNYSVITMVDGSNYTLTLQLGQIERRIAEMVTEMLAGAGSYGNTINKFIRIGKSLVVNRDYITFINPSRQKLTLSDGKSFCHNVSASRDALKALKELIEQEVDYE